jgi:hypothetical protein
MNDEQNRKPSLDIEVKWVWATIGSGIDIGITPERMVQILTKQNIKRIAALAQRKETK